MGVPSYSFILISPNVVLIEINVFSFPPGSLQDIVKRRKIRKTDFLK
jgi:hypothetical protein